MTLSVVGIQAEGAPVRLHQNNAVAQLLGGNIDAARSSFIRAINLLQVQGDTDAANQLREQVQGIVKLDGEAVA